MTLPGLLGRNADATPQRPAFRHRRRGIWRTWTWAEFARMTHGFALGLAAEDFGASQVLAVLGENRPELYAALLAAQALGGVGLPLHPDVSPEQAAALLHQSGAAMLVVEREAEAAALRPLMSPATAPAIVSCQNTPDAEAGAIRSFEAVVAAGLAAGAERREWLRASVAALAPERPALLCPPHLAALAHGELMVAARAVAAEADLGGREELFCYLPMSSIGDMIYSLALGLSLGCAASCPEAPHTVPRDLREIGPTFLLGPPPMLALMTARLGEQAAALSGLKRLVVSRLRHAGPELPRSRLRRRITALMFDAPVRDLLGLRRVRAIHVGPGGPLADDAAVFRSLGIRLGPAIGLDMPGIPSAMHELSHV